MKLRAIVTALLCVVVYAIAEKETSRWPTSYTSRFPREANPQNSINFQGSQPLSGPNRQPTWDLNFNRNIANNDRNRVDVFGGVGKVPGQRAQPHVGIEYERNFGNNGFIRGSGQVQPRPGGHGVSPSFGVTGGFRFRREANPQKNSINFQGSQALSGPNRQPSWDLNFNRNIANNDRNRVDVFGGVGKVPGQRAQPHVGIEYERNFGNNGFIRGSGQVQPRPGGHGVSPSFGVTGGFRFRREANPQKNSINFQGSQALSGPNRQPSWDLNFNRNIANNDRNRADIFGGVSKVPGQRAQPHVGIEYERNFGKNGFIRGSGQVQPRPGGHGVSPSFGVTGGFRFRREANPQKNSINFQGSQALSGPNRQPSWDLNFNRNIANNDRNRADIFGGVSKVPGQRAQPHVGIEYERNFGKNGFIRGSGQVQPRPGGHGVSPSFGVTGGFRFRREANPQKNSINFQGSQALSGPNRQPSWDLNFNRNIANNDRNRADIFGGVSKVPGQRAQPHVGIEYERNFGKNGFIRGSGQVQPRPGGHGVSPSFGVTGGFRFRREANPQKNSINFQGSQALSGPNRQPSWDLNFNRNIANNDRNRADIFGGVSKVPGQRAQPHVGIEYERNFGKNGFIRGSGQVQPRPGGHGVSPSFGVTGGFRFRREANPQKNSINFQGSQALSGPNRQPSWDLNFNRNIANNDRNRADIFGGVSKVPGQRAQPHVGIEYERNFGKNGFIRGSGQVQPRPGGRGFSPSFGVTGGFRFRRDVESQLA